MRILEAAVSGHLGSQMVPDEARKLLAEAALLILSATATTPGNYGAFSWGVSKEVDANDKLLRYTARFRSPGLLNRTLPWAAKMLDGIRRFYAALMIVKGSIPLETRRELESILFRTNIHFATFLKFVHGEKDDAFAFMQSMIDRFDDFLNTYHTLGVIPPDFLAHATAMSIGFERKIPRSGLKGWRILMEEGLKLSDQGDEQAIDAKNATNLAYVLLAAHKSLYLYASATKLLWWAISKHRGANRPAPADLSKEFAVVEEYRVAALELLAAFAHNLIYRPLMLGLIPHEGHSLGEGMKKGLISTRAEMSIYPNKLKDAWGQVISKLGNSLTIPPYRQQQTLRNSLEEAMRERLTSCFSDECIVLAACRLYDEWSHGGLNLVLTNNWRGLIPNCSKTLVKDSENY